MSRRVVITGTGAVTPLGDSVTALHERAVAGESGLTDGEGRCHTFDPRTVLTRKEIHRTDRFSQLALVSAEKAVQQAGWTDGAPYDPDRVVCVIGSAIGGVQTFEEQFATMRRSGTDSVSGLTVPMLATNAAAAQIAIRHGLRGEAYCLTSSCASSAQAIGAGLRTIRSGAADAAVVGGADSSLSNLVRSAYLNAGAMSPTGTSVPFDVDRNGFVMGEGAGVLVLESAESAERRGALILGEVLGYAATYDAFHVISSPESGTAAVAAVRTALADANVAPDDLDYLNAHGTGSNRNDRLEIAALREVLGDATLSALPLSSTKSVTGHLMGAAGAVEAIATVMALNHRMAPPTVGLRRPDAELGELAHVFRATPLCAPPPEDAGIALSTSFGFGGHNAALVLSGAGRPYGAHPASGDEPDAAAGGQQPALSGAPNCT